MAVIINGTTGITNVNGSASAPAETGTDTDTGLWFPAVNTVAWSTGGTEAMRIDSSQNVGIGTSSPAFRLNVVDSTGQVTERGGTIKFGDNGTYYGTIDYSYATNLFTISANGASQNIVFKTVSSERMRIDSSGNLLVGATSYAGSGLSLSSPNGSGSYSVFAAGGTGYHWRFGNVTNGIVGSISTSTTATSFTPSSDRRLKENIKSMTDGLARVMKLKPVTYNWITDGSEDDGFIAQDLQAIPEFERRVNPIDERDGETYYGVDYMRFVSVLTAAIQELKADLDATKAELQALKGA